MSTKKYLRGRLMLMLRRWGMLCKKEQPRVKKLRLHKSLLADGTEIYHNTPILKTDLPINNRSIDSEVHSWVEWKKGYNSACKFNATTKSCVCGKNLEQFATTEICKI